MPTDYVAIRAENRERYGTDIGRIGKMLLADRYDDRTHFIFELLQNAEDALARRRSPSGPRSVRFHLTQDCLRVSHFGKPFDEPDVRGICGIGESTKGMTAIGRFGIGFKSVYAFTDRPEVHSGLEDFAIESYVWPTPARPLTREDEETLILIPLDQSAATDHDEIVLGLRRLGAGVLLFLREIEEIGWAVDGGSSGRYRRIETDDRDQGVRRITVTGSEAGQPEVGETWLTFSRPVESDKGILAGRVELAFSVSTEEASGRERVQPVSESPLVVFFPTVLETHLGFLVQGPYRTTPSRDNVPRQDPWNVHCVKETAGLLVDALRWLRDHGMLDTAALLTLPIDRAKFGESARFSPLFEECRRLLSTEPLLPCFGGGYVSARHAKLARTQALRELFDPAQLTALFGGAEGVSWLVGDISQDRTPALREYLRSDLQIAEITPEVMLSRLSADFLEAQLDEWIERLYEFLSDQPALRRQASELPLIRLSEGRHVTPYKNGHPQAFLPGAIETDFPTIRRSVCRTPKAVEFLRSIKLGEPDAVDDVVQNVLPKYVAGGVSADTPEYSADIGRLVTAFATDSKEKRERLLWALRGARFVAAVDAGSGWRTFALPSDLYLPTDRLKGLFANVQGVSLVDDGLSCLRGEDVRKLLEACGAVRYLRSSPQAGALSWEEKQRLREGTGHAATSGRNDWISDQTLVGLRELIASFAGLKVEERSAKAKLLWEALADLEERGGRGLFSGRYTWSYYGSHEALFDSAFVRVLNDSAWIPDQSGSLRRPGEVIFESLGWKPDPFLESRIRFRPPIIDELAKAAGIEPGVVELLKSHGLTSVNELVARLGVTKAPESPEVEAGPKAPVDSSGQAPVEGAPRKDAPNGIGKSVEGLLSEEDAEVREPQGGDRDPFTSESSRVGRGTASGGSHQGGRKRGSFISYVAVNPDDDGPDPDGLPASDRMALEARAIDLVLAKEPEWHRTDAGNPGFDLYENGLDGQRNRWCEVKAMTCKFSDRPVGMSRRQFDEARSRGEAFWLYVVECADGPDARIVRIQDPAGKARTFTFDHGWIEVAEQERAED